MIKTRKTIAAGYFAADSLGDMISAAAEYPHKRKLSKTLCAPEKHKWQNRKHVRRCLKCGKEEARP